MYIKQISVFLENEKGRLEAFTKVLDDNLISLDAICIADTPDFGILRCIVADPETAVSALKAAGFTASITKVLAVSVTDGVGGMNKAVTVLSDSGVSIEYVYSMVKSEEGEALLIFKVDDLEKAGDLLIAAGIKVKSLDEIR
ncbi:MAG: hypothetical protein ACRCUS_06670 [Anaerovoracaceae bacterium]